jgi:hypothetical protein
LKIKGYKKIHINKEQKRPGLTILILDKINFVKNHLRAGHMPVVLAICEAKIRRIKVQAQPREIVCKTAISKNNQSKTDWRCGSSGRKPALQA